MTIATLSNNKTKNNENQIRSISARLPSDEEEAMKSHEVQLAPTSKAGNQPASDPQLKVVRQRGATIILDEDLYQRTQSSIRAQKIIAALGLFLVIAAVAVVLLVPRWRNNNDDHHPCSGHLAKSWNKEIRTTSARKWRTIELEKKKKSKVTAGKKSIRTIVTLRKTTYA